MSIRNPLSAHVATPTIEINDAGSSSSEKSDDEVEEGKKACVEFEEVLEGHWSHVEKYIHPIRPVLTYRRKTA